MSGSARRILVQGSIAALGALALVAALALAGAEGARAQAGGGGAEQEERGVFPPGGAFPYPLGPGGCCRWELASVRGHGGASAEASRGPVTMLLDQCSGRTWLLARGPRGEFEWLEVDRPGPWGFRLELE